MTNEEIKKKIQQEYDEGFKAELDKIQHDLDLLRERGFSVRNGLVVLLIMELKSLNFTMDSEGAIGMTMDRLYECTQDVRHGAAVQILANTY